MVVATRVYGGQKNSQEDGMDRATLFFSSEINLEEDEEKQ